MEERKMEERKIPKVIHYCWFGGNEKTELMKQCMLSWKKYCPDWEMIEWNESNFDVNFCEYASKAYKKKRYGFLADCARLQVIYKYGGVYLDTDVELLNTLEELRDNEAWFGYGTATEINTGSGFGAVAENDFVKKMLQQYIDMPANSEFKLCTEIDTALFKKEFPEFASNHDVSQRFDGVLIINNNWYYVIHHYTSTWQTPLQRAWTVARRRLLKKS